MCFNSRYCNCKPCKPCYPCDPCDPCDSFIPFQIHPIHPIPSFPLPTIPQAIGTIIPYSVSIPSDLSTVTSPFSLGFGATGAGVIGAGTLPPTALIFPIPKSGILKNLYLGLNANITTATGTITATVYIVSNGVSPSVINTGISTSISITAAGPQLIGARNNLNTYSVIAGQYILLNITTAGLTTDSIVGSNINAGIEILPPAFI
uniref:Uncharacterized protein n=1 Tax=viral metagenome TaxID=1070528 RepID=A0A6C0LTH7_9ZZZZ